MIYFFFFLWKCEYFVKKNFISVLISDASVSLDLVLLDKKSAVEVRTTLRTMLTDSERRQSLIQELVKSNNQLK